jgi:hypothetical protein
MRMRTEKCVKSRLKRGTRIAGSFSVMQRFAVMGMRRHAEAIKAPNG